MNKLISKSSLLEPAKLSFPDNWVGHIPFAFWLVENLKPRTLVELGTHSGNSYFAFCQGVAANCLTTQCYAVDIWRGDEHAGSYDESIFREVSRYNESNYRPFSKLLRMTFDQAAGQFDADSIDLLHIDGLHTYEAVKHDFELWRQKISARGVVLFHDIEVRERDFGVWRLWAELSEQHPHIEFDHSNGLGVLFLGKEQSLEMTALITAWSNPESRNLIKLFFAKLGRCVGYQYQSSGINPVKPRKNLFQKLEAELARFLKRVCGPRKK